MSLAHRHPRGYRARLPVAAVLLGLLAARPVGAQLPHDPWQLERAAGRSTISERAKAMSLPPGHTLEAQVDWDRDGRDEVFVAWRVPLPEPRQFENHLQVLAEDATGATRAVREFVIRDTGLLSLEVVVPPDGRDTIKVLASAPGGSYWANLYVLQATSDTPFELGGTVDTEFVDLDGDGIYEAVAWDRRPDERRCQFGMFGVRVRPRAFVRSGKDFRQVWPTTSGSGADVMAQLADLDHDGRPELVALEEDGAKAPGTRRLAVYKMSAARFVTLATATLPTTQVGFFMTADDGEIHVEVATPEQCDQGGRPPESFITYEFRAGALHKVRQRGRHVLPTDGRLCARSGASVLPETGVTLYSGRDELT
jgi:hypothetical protein